MVVVIAGIVVRATTEPEFIIDGEDMGVTSVVDDMGAALATTVAGVGAGA